MEKVWKSAEGQQLADAPFILMQPDTNWVMSMSRWLVMTIRFLKGVKGFLLGICQNSEHVAEINQQLEAPIRR